MEEIVRLRIEGEGGVRVHEVRELLDEIEHAYNSILVFEGIVESWEKSLRTFRRMGPPDEMFHALFSLSAGAPFRHVPALRGNLDAARHEVARGIPRKHRLTLEAVRLESPGWWSFLGKINPLNVMRKSVNDYHERRKDREYREAAEKRKLELENMILENEVISGRVEALKGMGATEDDLAMILNQHVFAPLEALRRQQDKGLIIDAVVEEIDAKPPRKTTKK